jgi:hypothetical protein
VPNVASAVSAKVPGESCLARESHQLGYEHVHRREIARGHGYRPEIFRAFCEWQRVIELRAKMSESARQGIPATIIFWFKPSGRTVITIHLRIRHRGALRHAQIAVAIGVER